MIHKYSAAHVLYGKLVISLTDFFLLLLAIRLVDQHFSRNL